MCCTTGDEKGYKISKRRFCHVLGRLGHFLSERNRLDVISGFMCTEQFGSWWRWRDSSLTWIFMSHFILEWGFSFDWVGHPWRAGIYMRTLAPPTPGPRWHVPQKKNPTDLKGENDPFSHWKRVQQFSKGNNSFICLSQVSSLFGLCVGPTCRWWVSDSFIHNSAI